jgi:hypothetical protein
MIVITVSFIAVFMKTYIAKSICYIEVSSRPVKGGLSIGVRVILKWI